MASRISKLIMAMSILPIQNRFWLKNSYARARLKEAAGEFQTCLLLRSFWLISLASPVALTAAETCLQQLSMSLQVSISGKTQILLKGDNLEQSVANVFVQIFRCPSEAGFVSLDDASLVGSNTSTCCARAPPCAVNFRYVPLDMPGSHTDLKVASSVECFQRCVKPSKDVPAFPGFLMAVAI